MAAKNQKNKIILKNISGNISLQSLSPQILDAYCEIANRNAITEEFELCVEAIGGKGDNSIASVLKVSLTPTKKLPPIYTILKIAPTNRAKREHMNVKNVYAREVFMYSTVFDEFNALAAEYVQTNFSVTPQMLYASLKENEEFIIFEDLNSSNYMINSRANFPTYDLVVCAFRAIAQLHAMSFVLQARKPERFAALISGMGDNLFTTNTDEVTLEYGRRGVRLTRQMLEADLKVSGEDVEKTKEILQALSKIENNYHEICLDAVNGAACAPYAVICHGDFWNNNILYEFDSTDQQHAAINAKVIDFQISRYASPLLDLFHYLDVCIETPLRDAHFHEFMQIYYDTLAQTISNYQLDPKVLYPETIFRQQIRQFGVYGFCMASLAIPFIIATANELPDTDVVCEAIQEFTSSLDNSDSMETNKRIDKIKVQTQMVDNNGMEKMPSAAELIEKFEVLSERTLPIFKRRLIGCALDLQKYGMIETIMKCK